MNADDIIPTDVESPMCTTDVHDVCGAAGTVLGGVVRRRWSSWSWSWWSWSWWSSLSARWSTWPSVAGGDGHRARWWRGRWTVIATVWGGGAAAVASGEQQAGERSQADAAASRREDHLTSGTSAASSSGASDSDASRREVVAVAIDQQVADDHGAGLLRCTASRSVSIVAVPNWVGQLGLDLQPLGRARCSCAG